MQIVIQLIFLVLAVLIVGSALLVVTARNIVHAALWLVASFFGVSALYLLMQAEFLAIVQVLVYVGAISILMLFAIMLTRHITGQGEHLLYERWWIGAGVSSVLFVAVLVPTVMFHPWRDVPPPPPPSAMNDIPPGSDAAVTDAVVTDNAILYEEGGVAGSVELGTAFVHEYLLPFQVAAVLLLVALIGAIVVAYEERVRRRRVLTLAEEVSIYKRQQERRANGE